MNYEPEEAENMEEQQPEEIEISDGPDDDAVADCLFQGQVTQVSGPGIQMGPGLPSWAKQGPPLLGAFNVGGMDNIHLLRPRYLLNVERVANTIPVFEIKQSIGYPMGHFHRRLLADYKKIEREVLIMGWNNGLSGRYWINYWVWKPPTPQFQARQSLKSWASFPTPKDPYRKASNLFMRQQPLACLMDCMESIHVHKLRPTSHGVNLPNGWFEEGKRMDIIRFCAIPVYLWESMHLSKKKEWESVQDDPRFLDCLFIHRCIDDATFNFELVECMSRANLAATYRVECFGKGGRSILREDHQDFQAFIEVVHQIFVYLVSREGTSRWAEPTDDAAPNIIRMKDVQKGSEHANMAHMVVDNLPEKYSKNEGVQDENDGTSVGCPCQRQEIEETRLFDEQGSSEEENSIGGSDHEKAQDKEMLDEEKPKK